MTNGADYYLWLPSWYPNKLEPFNGDFIQRHAEAAALHAPIVVVYVVRDVDGVITSDFKIEKKQTNNLTEIIVYYYTPHNRFGFIQKAFSYSKFLRLYKRVIKDVVKQYGLPKLAHVHIVLRTGAIALWLQKRCSVPFAVTEHWTGYLPEEPQNYLGLPFYKRTTIQRVFKKSAGVSAVSHYLGRQLKALFSISGYTVIPNVVNTQIFKPADGNFFNPTKFVHISGLSYQKNIVGIINAFEQALVINPKVELHIIGARDESFLKAIQEKGLAQNIKVYTELPQHQLIDHLQNAAAFIFFSRFETFGCVIIEAHACGVPVIVSDIPVMHENVSLSNGMFIQSENEEALAKAIVAVAEGKVSFNRKEISTKAIDSYNYKKIGLQIVQWYAHLLNKC